MDTWLIVVAGLVMFGGIFVYVLFMVFLPEWVGITGKTAKEAQKAHQGEPTTENDLIARMHKDNRPKKDSN